MEKRKNEPLIDSISAGNAYTGAELLSYASHNSGVVFFIENGSSSIQANDKPIYDVVALEQGFIQARSGMNKIGELVSIRILY